MSSNSGKGEVAPESGIGASFNLHERDVVGLEIVDPDRGTDLLSQFRANLNQIEELNSRLRFVLVEIGAVVMRKRNE
jgi:hypothetical protein